VVAFNTAEGWSRAVTEDIARALLEREAREADLSESAKEFVECVLDAKVRPATRMASRFLVIALVWFRYDMRAQTKHTQNK
jgi:hypothetical protein